MHLRLTHALAKISCSHKRGRRRRLHRDAAAQGLHLAPFDATREGKGSEVESFHANKSLFSFIRSPKLNEGGHRKEGRKEGRLSSPCSLLQCH